MYHHLLETVENDNLMQHVLFSEATFHTCGHMHRHNCKIWAEEQLYKCAAEMARHTQGECMIEDIKGKSLRALHVH